MTNEEQHIEFVKDLKSQWAKSVEAFDKNLTLISSGALALSLTFVEKLGGADSPYIWLMICSWITFTLTLMGSLTSHWFSSKYHESTYLEYQKLDSIDFQEAEELGKQYLKLLDKMYHYNRLIKRLNFASFISLWIGVFALVIFVTLSTLNYKEDGKANTTTTKPTTEQPQPRHKRNASTAATQDTTIKSKEINNSRQ
ncbi:hypothetical protein [Pontibacter sp. SGAir0037]|uniref:hypothetical protein n=1 Tax=Pontibacter sp. SGAir0037 TaxID=2571030 RepID=UPI0010CD211B|nr:hypothetical protein [Pontibacter sp. SGAir0037]QCR23756.1 hypothetical protein C1N53_16320 [Pontibacter sp. SGAir0037]